VHIEILYLLYLCPRGAYVLAKNDKSGITQGCTTIIFKFAASIVILHYNALLLHDSYFH